MMVYSIFLIIHKTHPILFSILKDKYWISVLQSCNKFFENHLLQNSQSSLSLSGGMKKEQNSFENFFNAEIGIQKF